MLIPFRMPPVTDPMYCPADMAAARGNRGRLPTELAGNIAWMLWQTAATAPAAVALLERDRSYTYGALYDRALPCAEALGNCGVGPGDRVEFLL